MRVAGKTEVRGPCIQLHTTHTSKPSNHRTFDYSPAANMPPPIAPPDEQEFDQPQLIAGLLHPDLHAGNNVFWYFTSSPWFEPECLNINVWLNVRQNDPATAEQIMNDRKLWQQRLDDQPIGTQYVLAGEGQGDGHPWLLQRQNKVSVIKDDKEQIETFVEGNYYTHGTKMLMAPSLLDIVQSRLVGCKEYAEKE